MDWQLFSAYFLIGVGVSIGMGCELYSRPSMAGKYAGATFVAGSIAFGVFWPVVIVTLITLALIVMADR